jgi:hypothetical protein
MKREDVIKIIKSTRDRREKPGLIMTNLVGADLNITTLSLPIKGGQPFPVAVGLTDFGVLTAGAGLYSYRRNVAW